MPHFSTQENQSQPPSHSSKSTPSPSALHSHAQQFHQAWFPDASDSEWADWKWQMRNRIRTLEEAERIFELTDSEREAITRRSQRSGELPLGITPYYASILDRSQAEQGLRRTKIPTLEEFEIAVDERPDPLGEEDHSPIPGIVHTYPDKVLFLVTDFCATYCRYCTRSRMVGSGEFQSGPSKWQAGIDYIEAHPAIRDVLISGGDPLILSDPRLDWLLSRLHAIPHVEFIRFGTKAPAVLPQRITPELCDVLRKYPPIYMSIHFTHPDELTQEVQAACNRLADAGVVMGGQTVLLKGVNDSIETMKALNTGLLRVRVTPYYLHQCDPVQGSMHFRTPIQTGIDILAGLHGHTTGYAVPYFMIDAPGGGGKIPIGPNYVLGRDGDDVLLKNFNGETYRYRDPDFQS